MTFISIRIISCAQNYVLVERERCKQISAVSVDPGSMIKSVQAPRRANNGLHEESGRAAECYQQR